MKKLLLIILLAWTLVPLKSFSQNTSQSVPTPQTQTEEVRIPLKKANAIIQDLILYKNLRELSKIDSELITSLEERLALEKAVNASNEKTISLLKETINLLEQKDKPSFAKFMKNVGKIAIGAIIGAVGAIVVISAN